jgi:thioesterase domain-containing protein
VAEVTNALVPLRVTGNRTPLFCVHAVSGSAYAYTGLLRQLDPQQPVYGFEAPGFDDGRTPVRSLPELSAEYMSLLQAALPDGPYQLLGWSMGGVLAFDMAQHLLAAGGDVTMLVLIDSAVPTKGPLPTEKAMLRKFLHDLMSAARIPQDGVDELFALFPDTTDPAAVFAAVETGGTLPAEIDTDFLASRYVVFRAHIESLFNYEITGTYDGNLTVIKAAESDQEYMNWEAVAAKTDNHVLPGDHHSIWFGDSQLAMAAVVQRALDNARSLS